MQGIQRVPQSVLDLPRAYGASAWTELRAWSRSPQPCLSAFAATRLTVPRALWVMIAEWLATGTGLGNLLNQSRGLSDYKHDLDSRRRFRFAFRSRAIMPSFSLNAGR